MQGEEDELVLRYHPGDELMAPYERLLGDAMKGDPELFASEEAIEAAWRVVDPVLGDAVALRDYDPSSWGPADAQRLGADAGGWRTQPISGGAPEAPQSRDRTRGELSVATRSA
jgi:glucose-6-phosphate 1-dehydrogenase